MSSTDGGDLVTDITKLSLNDNFYEWFVTTNLLIDAVNPINIYDVTPRKGLTEYRSGGNVTIDVNTGKGLKAYPNAAIGALTFDFEALTSKTSVANDDLFVIESPTTGSSNDVYKISASNMLPPTIAGTHEFTGIVTAYALNVRDNVLRLQYGDTTTDNSSGLILDTTTSSKVSFLFDTTRSAWFSNRNIGLESGYSFLTNSSTRRSEFRFATNGSSQYDVGLDLLMGLGTTGSDDHSWLIEARHVDKAINFIYKTYTNTDVENRIFYATIDSVNPVTSTFTVADKLVIGNVAGSTTNFKSVTDYTASIIPISNASGVLDSKWTNRYVTTSYASGIVVGDLVKVYNDTNNQATVVKCALTTSSTEDEAYSLGIVERVSGGKVWVVMMGEFGGLTSLDTGAVYYLTTGSPNYTLTKPTTGIVKPVFVATSATTGVLFPMGAGGSLSFGKFNATASGGTLVSGSTVSSASSNDMFTMVAGSGISLETTPGSKSITIRASTAGNQPTYSSISTNSGTVSAYRPSETLSLIGSGGIVVSATDVASTNGDQITISGKYFRTISWSGDSTNDIASSKTANLVDDTFQIYAGTGISVQSYSGGLRIDATGTSTPLILSNSISISALIKQNINSILYTPNDASGVSAVTALQSATNTILGSDISTGAISWNSTLAIVRDKLAYATEASKYKDTDVGVTRYESLHYGLTTSDNTVNSRHFGIIRIPQNNTSLPGIKPIDVAAFMYNTTNSVNGALVGLQEGSGIELTTLNTTSNSISSIPTIKISSKYGAAFNKVRILDTGETVVANAVDTRTVTNLITYSDNLGATASFSFPTPPDPIGSASWADYKHAGWGASAPTTTNVASITGPLGTSVSAVKYVINVNTEDSGHYHIIPNHAVGKRYTYSVYAKSETAGTPIKFRLGYYNNTSIYSEEFTTTDSWQRFSFSFDVSSAGTLYAPGAGDRVCGSTYRYWTFASSCQVKHRFSSGQNSKAIHMYGAQLEEGQEMTNYISSAAKTYIVTTDASGDGATTYNCGNRWEYNFATAQYTMPESHGTLVFSTANSPILLDSDTNSDTIYFGIATNSITNNHLSLMADNTVKVGTGSTNANNTPQDLAIGTNSVLGRVGNGDLKSVSAVELAAIVGGNYFKTIVTDSGTLTAAQSNSIHLRGGSGTVVSVGTNNDIIITGGGSGTGLTLVSDWNGSTGSGVSSPDKLYFNDSDLNYTVSVKSGTSALISSTINWTGISGGASNGGAGLLYGKVIANGSPVTQIAQIGNGVASGSQLPFIDAQTGVLSYVNRISDETQQQTPIDRYLGFDENGNFVATTNLSSIFTDITVNSLSTNKIFSDCDKSIAIIMNNWLGVAGDRYQYTHLFASTGADWSSRFVNFPFSRNILTFYSRINAAGTGEVPTQIQENYFNISAKIFNNSWNPIASLCIPSNGIFIGIGPVSGTTASEGMRVSNDTTANALVFTNYNLSTNASITTRKDRSSRIGLGVLNVDSMASNAYASMKNTAYITHTYVPSLSTIVDEFTVTDNTKKSYKYLIHCENAAGEVFTSELLLLVKMVSGTQTTNLVQYGSIGTSAGFSLSFAFAVGGSGPYTGTLTHNGTSGGVAVKLLKYEV